MEELCSRTVQLLTKANNDGRLSAALTEMHQVPKPAAAPVKEDVEELRSRMAQVLMHATTNGRLFRALDQSEKRAAQLVPSSALVAAPKQPKMNIEDLRARAAHVLLESCATGQLSKVMEEINSNVKVAVPSSSSVEGVRMKVAQVLLKATTSGRLSTLLGEVAKPTAVHVPAKKMLLPPQESSKDICSRTAELLTAAAFDGSLFAALGKSVGFCGNSDILPEPSGFPNTLGPVPIELSEPRQPDICKMRSRMAQLLVQCASDGRLHTALDDMLHNPNHEDTKKPVVCAEDLRLKTGKLLLDSASNGRLLDVLNEVNQESQQEPAVDIEDLRFRTSKLLMDTACDGRLHSALRGIQGPHVEKHRVQAASALQRVLHSGRLPSLLQEAGGVDSVASLEQQRKHAASALISALSDGSLSSALQNMRTATALESPSARIEASRTKVAQLLLKAADSGRLNAVLKESQRPKQVDIEDLRLKTGQLLSNTMSDGRLAKALREMHHSSAPAPELSALERCRQRTAQLLMAAESDGRLVSALVEMQHAPQESHRPSDADIVRDRAAKALMRGEADGRLAFALQEMKTAQVSSARAQVIKAMSVGADRLALAFQEMRSEQEARLKADVVQVVPVPCFNESTRSRLAQVFAEGASSGRLSLAVQEIAEQRARTEPSVAARGLLAQTALLLKQGVANGNLNKALVSVMGPASELDEAAQPSAPEAPTAPPPNLMKPSAPVEAPPAAPPLEARIPVKPPGSRSSARPGRPVRPGSAATTHADVVAPEKPPARTLHALSPPPPLEESPVPRVPTAPPKAPSTPSGSGAGFRRRHNKAAPDASDVPVAPSARHETSTTEIDWKAALGLAPTVAALDLGARQHGRFGNSSWAGASAMAMDLGGDAPPITPRTARRPAAASLGPCRPLTPTQQFRAASLGPKSLTKKQSMLPALSARGQSSDPLAWSMGVSRPKWGGTVF